MKRKTISAALSRICFGSWSERKIWSDRLSLRARYGLDERTSDGSLGENPWGISGDEGYGHQLMDRMQEERFYLQRFNNGSPAKRSEIYANLSAEWSSTVGQLIERRQIIIPNDESSSLS